MMLVEHPSPMDSLITSFQTLQVDANAPKFIYTPVVQPQSQPQHQPLIENRLCTWIGCSHGTAMDVDDVFCLRRSDRLAVKSPVNYKGMCK